MECFWFLIIVNFLFFSAEDSFVFPYGREAELFDYLTNSSRFNFKHTFLKKNLDFLINSKKLLTKIVLTRLEKHVKNKIFKD